MQEPKYLAIHHTAVYRSSSPQLLAVDRYHKDKWGMKSSLGWFIGYNEFVDVDGSRTKTRAWGEETVANKGHNCDVPSRCDTYSVCFALDGDLQDLTAAQENTFRKIRAEHPNSELTLHKLIQKDRTCPGQRITLSYLKSLNTEDQQKKLIEDLQRSLDALKILVLKLLGKVS